MRIIEGGVCAAKGFLAAGIAAGIKQKSNNRDLALIFSETPACAAGVFTTNKVKSACVTVSKEHLKNNKAQAIIVNSGNANCCTGPQGLLDAKQTAEAVASALNIAAQDVLVASTGVIGRPLPMGKIINGISQLSKRLSSLNSSEVAQAIMTTDTVQKESTVSFLLDGKVINVGGAAKGSGMLYPNMATMLCFITTDAVIEPAALKAALKLCVDKTFNCVSVDGDMSTNDMALILANGASGSERITLKTKGAFNKFTAALLEVTETLAKMLAKDGEGATKLVEVLIKGAASSADAKIATKAVCNSNLVKTAIYGQDANWGRIAAAVGSSAAKVDINHLSIYMGKVKILSKGKPTNVSEDILKKILSENEINITVDLGVGNGTAKMWTCDLSEEYIRINAKYRT